MPNNEFLAIADTVMPASQRRVAWPNAKMATNGRSAMGRLCLPARRRKHLNWPTWSEPP